MNISLKRRLVRLERRFGVEASQARYPEYIAEQWLTIFEKEEAKGVYVDERDFPLACGHRRPCEVAEGARTASEPSSQGLNGAKPVGGNLEGTPSLSAMRLRYDPNLLM